MPSLCEVVRQELRRYSEKLCQTLVDLNQQAPVTDIDNVGEILSKVHALFDDDFLDRLEPSTLWIPPLFEYQLVLKSAQLIDRILQVFYHAKSVGLFSTSAVRGHRVKRQVWAQLTAFEVGHAAFPIQWAVQACQVEAASTPAPQRQGNQLLEHLSASPVLQALAGAARFVKDELWTAGVDSSSESAATSPHREGYGPVSAAANEACAADAAKTARQPRNSMRAILERLGHALNESECSGGDAAITATAIAGARVLCVVAGHLSALPAIFDDQDMSEDYTAAATTHGAATLFNRLKDSGMLTALCSAVLAAPMGPLMPTSVDAVADYYKATLADVQLGTCMTLWDLTALFTAPFSAAVGTLLTAPEVLQLRRTALDQVAASVPLRALENRERSMNFTTGGNGDVATVTVNGVRSGSCGGVSRNSSSGGGNRNSSGGWSRSSSGGGGRYVGPAAACWPLLQCSAVRRVYATRGLQFPDVIHILVDAALGAVNINLSQDDGGHTAAAAAAQFFPSRYDAADLALRVCRALFAHAAGEPQPILSRCGSSLPSPYVSAGGGVGSCSRRSSTGGNRLSASQRAQLADDASSVEVALRIRMIGAPPEELQACMPAILGVRSWVQRLAAAACPGPSAVTAATAAAAAAAAAANPGLMTWVLHEDSPRPSDLSSLSSPDATAIYGNAQSSPRCADTGHRDHLTSLEESGKRESPTDAAAADAAASPAHSSFSTASKAGPTSVPDVSKSGPSATGSTSKLQIKPEPQAPTQRGAATAAGPLRGPLTTFSPGHSPGRPAQQSQRPSSGLRRSLDRFKRWVAARRSQDDLPAPADAEAEIVLPMCTQTPLRHGNTTAAAATSTGGGKAWQRTAQLVPAAPLPQRHTHAGAAGHPNLCRSPLPLSPTPSQRQQQKAPRMHFGTPSRAQSPRHTTQPGAAMTALASPPSLVSAGGIGGGGWGRYKGASVTPLSLATPRLASPPAVDIIARIPVIHSPEALRGGDEFSQCGSGRCEIGCGPSVSQGPATAEKHGVTSPRYPVSILGQLSPARVLVDMEAEEPGVRQRDTGCAVAEGRGGKGAAVVAATGKVAVTRRSVLRSRMLTAPLQLTLGHGF